jgi:hypothetical protein
MVRKWRDLSPLAEADGGDLVYQVAWNQWEEGQMIELAAYNDAAPFPGKYGSRYLDAIQSELAGH